MIELCDLVHDNSHGKCNYCAMPTETLVLGVLKILANAGLNFVETVDNNVHVSAKKSAPPHSSLAVISLIGLCTNLWKVFFVSISFFLFFSHDFFMLIFSFFFELGHTHASRLSHTVRIEKDNPISNRDAAEKNATNHPDKNACMKPSHLDNQVTFFFGLNTVFCFFLLMQTFFKFRFLVKAKVPLIILLAR